MYRSTQFLIGMTLCLLLVFIAGVVPWTSRTSVEVSVTTEDGEPVPDVKATFFNAEHIVIGEGITDRNGTVHMTVPTNWNSDWGKAVKRVEIFVDGYVTQKTTLKNSEVRAGSISGWLPVKPPLASRPHMLYRIEAKFICKKIA